MRRVLFAILSLCLFLPLSAASIATAQDATPASRDAFAGLDLPTLDITITADAYEGIPTSIPAGRYVVTVHATEETGEFGGGIGFVQPPAGMTADDFLANAFGPPDESGVGAAAATPVEGAVASPVATGGPPAFIADALFAGGTFIGPGQTTRLVVDLPPGEWIAWGDDPAAPWAPVMFEATGEMPTDLPEPEAAATIVMGEYVIEVAEGALAGGSQVVRIDNIGAQPHFIIASRGPDDMTEDQVATVLDEEMQAEMTGTPAAYSDLDPNTELTQEGFFSGTQSGGTSLWLEVDMPPGRYVLVCFFPDLGDGVPHAFHGMYTVVEVGA